MTRSALLWHDSLNHGIVDNNHLKALIEEIILLPNKTSYQSLRTCDLELELTHENKGIESIQFYDAGEKGIPESVAATFCNVAGKFDCTHCKLF